MLVVTQPHGPLAPGSWRQILALETSVGLAHKTVVGYFEILRRLPLSAHNSPRGRCPAPADPRDGRVAGYGVVAVSVIMRSIPSIEP